MPSPPPPMSGSPPHQGRRLPPPQMPRREKRQAVAVAARPSRHVRVVWESALAPAPALARRCDEAALPLPSALRHLPRRREWVNRHRAVAASCASPKAAAAQRCYPLAATLRGQNRRRRRRRRRRRHLHLRCRCRQRHPVMSGRRTEATQRRADRRCRRPRLCRPHQRAAPTRAGGTHRCAERAASRRAYPSARAARPRRPRRLRRPLRRSARAAGGCARGGGRRRRPADCPTRAPSARRGGPLPPSLCSSAQCAASPRAWPARA